MFYNYFLLQLLSSLWSRVEISQTKMAQVEKVYMVKNLKMKTFIIRYSVENTDCIRFLKFQWFIFFFKFRINVLCSKINVFSGCVLCHSLFLLQRHNLQNAVGAYKVCLFT